MAWLNVIFFGLLKIPMSIAALFVVPFLDDDARVNHPVFGVRDATDLSYSNIGFRNSVHNWLNKPTPNFTQTGNAMAREDWSLENRHGFQWRYRISDDSKYVSFRATWGKIQNLGKKEFYIGWTMDRSRDYMRVTFFQFTPFRGIF